MLGSLDQGINALTTRLAKSGSEYERAQQNVMRNSKQIVDVTQLVSREGDIDYTKACKHNLELCVCKKQT